MFSPDNVEWSTCGRAVFLDHLVDYYTSNEADCVFCKGGPETDIEMYYVV